MHLSPTSKLGYLSFKYSFHKLAIEINIMYVHLNCFMAWPINFKQLFLNFNNVADTAVFQITAVYTSVSFPHQNKND